MHLFAACPNIYILGALAARSPTSPDTARVCLLLRNVLIEESFQTEFRLT
jgi:hypothetical protein